MLGRTGLDINDPTDKYTLKALPGKFSGLHLWGAAADHSGSIRSPRSSVIR